MRSTKTAGRLCAAAIVGAFATLVTILPANARWVSGPPMLVAEDSGPAVEVINGVIYVAGGSNAPGTANATLQAYDPSSNSWRLLQPMPVSLNESGHGTINSKLYIVGGGGGVTSSNVLLIYDPPSNSWTFGTPAPFAVDQGASGVIDSKLYITGDSTGRPSLAVYDPATSAWTLLHNSLVAHGAPASGVINGKLYVSGGGVPFTNGMMVNVTEVYDPATDVWTQLAPIPFPVENPASAVINGRLYVIGGCTNSATGCNVPVNNVQVYDPIKNIWTTGTSLPFPLLSAGACSEYGFVFVLGGSSTAGVAIKTNERLAVPPSIP